MTWTVRQHRRLPAQRADRDRRRLVCCGDWNGCARGDQARRLQRGDHVRSLKSPLSISEAIIRPMSFEAFEPQSSAAGMRLHTKMCDFTSMTRICDRVSGTKSASRSRCLTCRSLASRWKATQPSIRDESQGAANASRSHRAAFSAAAGIMCAERIPPAQKPSGSLRSLRIPADRSLSSLRRSARHRLTGP